MATDREVVQSDQRLWIHPTSGGGKDVFNHISAVERADRHPPNEDNHPYEVVSNRGKEWRSNPVS